MRLFEHEKNVLVLMSMYLLCNAYVVWCLVHLDLLAKIASNSIQVFQDLFQDESNDLGDMLIFIVNGRFFIISHWVLELLLHKIKGPEVMDHFICQLIQLFYSVNQLLEVYYTKKLMEKTCL